MLFVYAYHQTHIAGPMKKCAGCKFARYCCRRCQKADWKNGHRHQCARIAQAGGEWANHKREHCQMSYGLLSETEYDQWETFLSRWCDPTDPFKRFMIAAQPFFEAADCLSSASSAREFLTRPARNERAASSSSSSIN
jgi:hypothetical protein